MKKIVILDFDGTLADTKPVIVNTFHRNHPKYADLCLPFKLSNFASKKQCSI